MKQEVRGGNSGKICLGTKPGDTGDQGGGWRVSAWESFLCRGQRHLLKQTPQSWEDMRAAARTVGCTVGLSRHRENVSGPGVRMASSEANNPQRKNMRYFPKKFRS